MPGISGSLFFTQLFTFYLEDSGGTETEVYSTNCGCPCLRKQIINVASPWTLLFVVNYLQDFDELKYLDHPTIITFSIELNQCFSFTGFLNSSKNLLS